MLTARICGGSSSSMRATPRPSWIDWITALQAPSSVANGHTADKDPLGDAVEAHGDLGDDAERAFRADQQPRQVVAGRRLAGALRRLDDRAVGHHRRDVEHVLAHGAVAHGGGAGGARRRHAADGRLLGAGIDGEEQPEVAQVVVELLARYAGLDHGVEVALVDGQHPVHAREVEGEAAVRGVDVALQRGAGAERDDRHAMRARHPHHLDDLLLALHPDHGVGRLIGDPGDGVGVLAADRLAGLQPVREALPQHGDGGGDIGRMSSCSLPIGVSIPSQLGPVLPPQLRGEGRGEGRKTSRPISPLLGNDVHTVVLRSEGPRRCSATYLTRSIASSEAPRFWGRWAPRKVEKPC